MPRPSWPLNLELQDFNGTLTVEATPRPGFEVPQLTTYLGRVEGVNSFPFFSPSYTHPIHTYSRWLFRAIASHKWRWNRCDRRRCFRAFPTYDGWHFVPIRGKQGAAGTMQQFGACPNLSHNNYSLLLPEGELVAPNLNSWEDQAASQWFFGFQWMVSRLAPPRWFRRDDSGTSVPCVHYRAWCHVLTFFSFI